MPEPVNIRELPFWGKLVLRGGADVRERAGTLLGFPLPERPLRASVGDGAEALWLGPDEWLLLVPAATIDAVTAALGRELAGSRHALVGVSHRFTGFSIAGAEAEDTLAAGCPLDLHRSRFPEGSSTRTMLGKAEIVLHRPEGGMGFRLYVARSFASYAWLYLEAAAREFMPPSEGLA